MLCSLLFLLAGFLAFCLYGGAIYLDGSDRRIIFNYARNYSTQYPRSALLAARAIFLAVAWLRKPPGSILTTFVLRQLADQQHLNFTGGLAGAIVGWLLVAL